MRTVNAHERSVAPHIISVTLTFSYTNVLQKGAENSVLSTLKTQRLILVFLGVPDLPLQSIAVNLTSGVTITIRVVVD